LLPSDTERISVSPIVLESALGVSR